MKLLFAVASAALACACSPSSSDSREPVEPLRHVILITLDTLRADKTSPYGCAHDTTPHLKCFAAQSVQYERAYTTMPTTGPAHISILTGLYPEEHGSLRNGLPAHKGLESLPALLKQSGRRTAAFVSAMHLSKESVGIDGFDTWNTPQGVRDGAKTVDLAMRWLEEQGDHPCFLWLHLFDPHAPYEAHEDLSEELETLLVPLQGISTRGFYMVGEAGMSKEEARKRELLYEADIYYTDQQVGRMLEFLDARDSASRDLVVITADHGELLTELLATKKYAFDHGEYLLPGEIQVPLWIRMRGLPAGVVEPRVVETRALFSSILRATGTTSKHASPCLPQFESRLDAGGAAGSTGKAAGTSARDLAFITRRTEDAEGAADDTRYGVVDEHYLALWHGDGSTPPELYDLTTDRLGLTDVHRDHAAITEERASTIEAWRARLVPATGAMPAEGLSDEMKKHLDALGY